jgi:chromosome segregation ATPase
VGSDRPLCRICGKSPSTINGRRKSGKIVYRGTCAPCRREKEEEELREEGRADLRAEMAMLQVELERKQSSLVMLHDKQRSLSKEVTRRGLSIKALEIERDRLREHVSHWKTAEARATAALTQSREIQAQLVNKTETQKRHFQSMEQAHDALQEELLTTQNEYDQLDEAQSKLLSDLQLCRQGVERTSESLDDAKRQVTRLQRLTAACTIALMLSLVGHVFF